MAGLQNTFNFHNINDSVIYHVRISQMDFVLIFCIEQKKERMKEIFLSVWNEWEKEQNYTNRS